MANVEHHRGHGGGLRHDFSDAEHWATMFEGAERDEWQRPAEVVELMEVAEGMTVADLGAGTGYFLPHLAWAVGKSGRVLGLDPEQGMVDYMAERVGREGWQNVEVRRIPFDSPELEEGSVDRVLIVNTWHHIGERVDYTGLLRRALTPGGAVYVVDFTRESPTGPPVEHRLAPERVIAELTEGGLSAELAEESLPNQYVVIGRRP